MVLPELRPYVASLTAYDVDLGAPGVHIGMPSTTLTFVLPVGEPLDVGWAGESASRARRWSTVSGLHARPAAIHHYGTQHGIQLALTTAGARALLGIPASDLARELVELPDVTPGLRHLPEQLSGARTPQERVRIVERALLAALGRHGAPQTGAEVGHALARLTRGAGVQEVADEVGYSRRHLTTLVRSECGLAPKEYQRVARFETSHRLLVRAARSGRPSLARISAEAGYADQSHLAREWSVLAGCPPTSWLREEFPFVQDSVSPQGAG
ncbi:AraC family transcriptional regulator [Nocardioides sp.]|uniref:helix-turn-helix domain-containing protein n=1 Tax=Nocardioides sp. TaxID=35761 RepID=UPI0031FEB3EC|nr:AraC family transcriptional regulator [Nocardioides sp.]